MGIPPVTDADHQPGGVPGALSGPAEPRASSCDDSGIGRHINTLNTRNRIESAEISNGSQVLITGSTDQFDPATLAEGIVTGCQRTGDRQ
mgnify:CR=1|tara:strand:+ start:1214 stop:1483 length:270 start_codon:yes stop_codon:yes gene_type:complete